MIGFTKFVLNNGLKVIVHEDRSSPLVAMNILYNVGSRDEKKEMTGLAHLLEHLMFCGSVNIPEFDLPLQLAAGENNAFTNNDITDYYLTIPSENIETGFWLESDRMLDPAFTSEKTEIQKNVVTEEFRQRYLNQPYGDIMHLLRPLAYSVHPYRWPTVGMDIAHIGKITNEDVREFFNLNYAPGNAILAISGNIETDKALKLATKWFEPIPSRPSARKEIPPEPIQTEKRELIVTRNVPADALYKVWHIGPRNSDDFFTLDLLTDILAGGDSGRLHNILVRDKHLFTEINAYITSDIDPGLLVMSGKVMKGVDIGTAEKELLNVVEGLKNSSIPSEELEKVKNRYETSAVLSNTGILQKAMNLSINELLGDAGMVNTEVARYRNIKAEMVSESAARYLTDENSTTLHYLSDKKSK